MKFKGNEIKFLRRNRRLAINACWSWMSNYFGDESFMFNASPHYKIMALKKAVFFYEKYKKLDNEFKFLLNLYKKYKGTNIGWD